MVASQRAGAIGMTGAGAARIGREIEFDARWQRKKEAGSWAPRPRDFALLAGVQVPEHDSPPLQLLADDHAPSARQPWPRTRADGRACARCHRAGREGLRRAAGRPPGAWVPRPRDLLIPPPPARDPARPRRSISSRPAQRDRCPARSRSPASASPSELRQAVVATAPANACCCPRRSATKNSNVVRV